MSPALKTAAGNLQAAGAKMTAVGKGLTLGVTLPLAAVGAASVKMASDAEEAANKFDVVMGDSSDSVRDALERLTDTIPLTRSEMEGLAAGAQDMLVPMGVARDEAAGMSLRFVELAGDLGSFNNVGTDQVLMAIQSALAGSSEPMRRYGVDTREAALEAIALKEGLIEQGEEMTTAARAQAVLLAIQKDSTDAMGDAARTADSTANLMKFLARDVRQLGIDIGQVLIPVVRPMLAQLREWLTDLRELDPVTQKWVVGLGFAAAALGPLLVALGMALPAIGAIVAVLTGPVGIVVALGALLMSIGPVRDVLFAFFGYLKDRAMLILGGIVEAFQKFGEAASWVLDKLSAAGRAVGDFTGITNEADRAVSSANAQLDEMAKIGNEVGFRYELVDGVMQKVFKTAGSVGGAVLKANAQLDMMAANGEEVGFRYEAVDGVLRKVDTTTGKLIPVVARLVDEVDGAGGGADELAESFKLLGITTGRDLAPNLEALQRAVASNLVPKAQLRDLVDDLSAQMSTAIGVTDDMRDALAELRAEVGLVAREIKILNPPLLELTGNQEAARQKMMGLRIEQDKWLDALSESVPVMNNAAVTSEELLKGLDALGGSAEDLGEKGEKGFTLFGMSASDLIGKVRGAIDVLSEITGIDVPGWANAAVNALDALARGDMWGAILSGIAAVAGAFKALLGLFKSASVGEDLGRDLGVQISDGLMRSIEGTADQIGDIYSAITLRLGDVMREVGISSAAQLETFAARTRDLFSHIEQGLLSTEQVQSVINAQFGQLVAAAEEFGGAGVEQIQELIELAERFGVTIDEELIAKFHELSGTVMDEGQAAWIAWAESVGVSFDKAERHNRAYFEALAAQMGLSAQTAAAFVEGMLGNQREAAKEFEREQRQSFRQAAIDAGLSGEQIREFVRGNLKIIRTEERQAARDRKNELRSREIEEITSGKLVKDRMIQFMDLIEGRWIRGYANMGAAAARFAGNISMPSGGVPSFQTHPGEFKVVPGPPSQPVPIMAHGGEVVMRPGGGSSTDTSGVEKRLDSLNTSVDRLAHSLRRQQAALNISSRDRSLMGN